jgi:protein-tyrosine-phosphatase
MSPATVLFVCVHNAGRSQMAAGYLQALGGSAVTVLSAGSEPAESLNPEAVAVMAEDGIDISQASPQVLSPDSVKRSDLVITMGCGDVCPVFPGTRYEDWQLEDPAGKDRDTVRSIRDDIKRRVIALLKELPAS